MSIEECFVCRKHRGEVDIAGGAIYEDDQIYVGAARPDNEGRTYLGYVFVETKRHVPTLSDLSLEEGAALGRQLARLSQALRELLGVVHVYAFVLGDNTSHIHVHLIGRYPDAPREYWGIRVDEWPAAPRGGRAEVEALCERLRMWLAAHPEGITEHAASGIAASQRSGDLSVVRAEMAHLDQLAPLFVGYREFYKRPPEPARSRAFLQERLERGDSVIFLALRDDGTAAGFTQLFPSFSTGALKRLWILNDLFVAPEFRRHGVGRLLLERARAFAQETDARGLMLETQTTNTTAQSLYESLGWQRDREFYVYTLNL
ncbi:MAG TPA: GNAT family N-acetyltransferase [Ktedonobacterales bacterium]|nr:GNAT family N-acetyltransferase [Ktedonobacterales bacterium]